jgi:Mrp family chromosome partitioning ATPase
VASDVQVTTDSRVRRNAHLANDVVVNTDTNASKNNQPNVGKNMAQTSSIDASPSATNGSPANSNADRVPGRIITFYSYKGGVGRSFALANVAAILSRWGARVLCVDWDLEAPGLHHFFPESTTRGPDLSLLQLLESAAPPDSSRSVPSPAGHSGTQLDWKTCVHTETIGQT